MGYILMSLIIAMVFGLAVDNVYGTQALMQYAWVDYTFWWIIGSGVIMAAVSPVRENLCRFFHCRLPAVCHGQPCG